MKEKLLKKLKGHLRKLLVVIVKKLPISSEIVGQPKGYYRKTRDLLNEYEKKSSKKISVEFNLITKEYEIKRKLPKTINQEIHHNFHKKLTIKFPETFVLRISNGRVYGNNGTVISPNDKLIGDLSQEFGIDLDNLSNHSIFRQWRLPPLKNIQGKVAVLSTAGGQTYFHWLFDVLPRLELLKKADINFDTIDQFVINEYNQKFHRETLSLLEIEEKKIIESKKNPHIKASQLIVPSLAHNTGNMSKWSCDFLRKSFLDNLNLNKSDHKLSKIYISRSKASYRKIINEPELIEVLNKYDFQICYLELMPFVEQVSLLASANIVIAPHGAGLSNLVFCNPGTKVIEIYSPHYVNVCFWSLANQMGLDYYYLIGDKINENDQRDHAVKENILIDIKSFKKIFNLVLNP